MARREFAVLPDAPVETGTVVVKTAGGALADISLTVDGDAIEGSTLTVAADRVIPAFYGPPDGTSVLVLTMRSHGLDWDSNVAASDAAPTSGPSQVYGYAMFNAGGATDTVGNQHWTLHAGSDVGDPTATVDGVDDTKIVFTEDGICTLAFEIRPANGADTAGIQLADAATEFWNNGFFSWSSNDMWQVSLRDATAFPSGTWPGLLVLPPLKVLAGDWLQFNAVAAPAAGTAAIYLHVTRTA